MNKSSVKFEFIRPNVFHFIPSGKFTEEEVLEAYESVNKVLESKKDLYFIATVSDLQSYPIHIRKFVFDAFERYFKERTILHVYMVSPSLFVKMMIGLVNTFYKTISLSICASVEEALQSIDSKSELNHDIKPAQVNQVLQTGISQHGIEVMHHSHVDDSKDGPCIMDTLIIKPNIVFVRLSGKIDKDIFDLVYMELERAVEMTGGPVHYVADLKGVTSLTREAKRFFQEESKWHDHQLVHKYFELSYVAKALFRIFSFVNSKYIQTTSIITDSVACIAKLLADNSDAVITQGEPATTIELTEESLNNFTKEELIEYLLLSHQENKRLNNLIRTRVNSMYEIISNMTWKEDFKTQQMETLAEGDPFQEIFLAINILQSDVGDMIAKLRFLNANLENEVLARTQELSESKLYLEEQNIKLKKINYELDTFIYRASHDLRAPLSSIQGLVSLAGKEKNSEMTDSYLSYVHQTTAKMDQLLREITDLTKNIKLEIQADKIDFKKIVEDSIQQLGSFDPLRQVNIETDIQTDQLISTDAFRMKMIFSNLIGNSIKYRRVNADTKIKIHVKTDYGLARIVVEDNGQGIHELHLPYIFDMFYRANDQTYGTGLGLYMVKEAVTKMNGEIHIESEYGKGTKVFIEIPSIIP